MFMAARPASLGSLDLFNLALELVEHQSANNDQLLAYAISLLDSARNLLVSTQPSSSPQPDAIQLALTMNSNAQLYSLLENIHSQEDITPKIAQNIRKEMGLEIAC